MSDTLRSRFDRAMQIRGYSDRTRHSYLSDVQLMVKRTQMHPARMTEEDITAYLSSLLNEYAVAPATYRQHLTAINHFYRMVLDRDFGILRDARPVRRKKLPPILSEKEVRELIRRIRIPHHRLAVTVAYSCGLRRSEVLGLRPFWIEREGRQLHVNKGKGFRDRLVPLPARIYQRLREFWKNHPPRGGELFFESRLLPGRPVSPKSLLQAVHAAAQETKIACKVTMHTFRHCYATHLLEHGVDLRIIQQFLGHRSPETTAIYTHLTDRTVDRAHQALDELTRDL